MSKILKAIRKHYPQDYKLITKTFRTVPLMLRQAIQFGVPYIQLDTGEDSVFAIIAGEKTMGGFDMEFSSPRSYMFMSYRYNRVEFEYNIEPEAENNINHSINRALKGKYQAIFYMNDGKLDRESDGKVVSIDLCKGKKK